MFDSTCRPVQDELALVVCSEIADLDPRVKELSEAGQTPLRFFQQLLDARRFSDAILFLANALSVRAATRWACQCVEAGLAVDLEPAESLALVVARRWVERPSEYRRHESAQAAEAAGLGTAAGLLAFTVGDVASNAPIDSAGHTPENRRAASNLARVVLMAAAMRRGVMLEDPTMIADRLMEFGRLGVEIVRGSTSC